MHCGLCCWPTSTRNVQSNSIKHLELDDATKFIAISKTHQPLEHPRHNTLLVAVLIGGRYIKYPTCNMQMPCHSCLTARADTD